MESGLVSRATSSTQLFNDAFDVLISKEPSTYECDLVHIEAAKIGVAIIPIGERLMTTRS